MIKKNIILRTSNELGNQMFMYASAFAISKKLDRNLLIDNETAFLLKKNISAYGLNYFNISSPLAPDRPYLPAEFACQVILRYLLM